jgi:sterol desaturase/sphingolipid hydroxylase (fatty acid hydroxylase superfamily)
MLYWIHRLAHKIPILLKYHADHHLFINKTGKKSKWEFNNIFLFNDTKKSTIDLWISEVVPTIIFSIITGEWFIFLFYYIWAAFFQEYLEHNDHVNVPLFSFGRWHLVHHKIPNNNFGLFFPVWDIIFKTNKDIF